MEAGPPDFGCFVQDLDEETLLAAARNEKGENELNQSDSRQMALRWGAGGHPSATNEHHAQLQLTVQMDDSFQLSFTHVRMPPMSSGRKRKLKPSHSASTSFKKKKLSVLIIKNGDELCCTRAIVAAKARLDQHPNWDGFKRGRRIQAEHAVDLHHKLRVPRDTEWEDRGSPATKRLYVSQEVQKLSQTPCGLQTATRTLTPKEEQAECRAKQRPGCCLRGAAAGLATVHSNEDNVPSTSLLPSPPVDGVNLNDEKLLLHVFFDMEAM
ncbi:hypothetical protein pdam_00019910 [Pocillopora damicornis]|uniref:Uncharacterized protein n=1 Tax=Pocillopora damicornis TaxID=46731 RepID=A0A3M6UFI2_POCDA|nr:hypothetical protein pdam_00019910 [Pocillopora damicornis]